MKKAPSIAKKAFAQAQDDDDSDSDTSATSTKSRCSNRSSDDSSYKSIKSRPTIGWQGKKGKQGFMFRLRNHF
jgi:hypothetical protein